MADNLTLNSSAISMFELTNTDLSIQPVWLQVLTRQRCLTWPNLTIQHRILKSLTQMEGGQWTAFRGDVVHKPQSYPSPNRLVDSHPLHPGRSYSCSTWRVTFYASGAQEMHQDPSPPRLIILYPEIWSVFCCCWLMLGWGYVYSLSRSWS